jgi:hypothetical protein
VSGVGAGVSGVDAGVRLTSEEEPSAKHKNIPVNKNKINNFFIV